MKPKNDTQIHHPTDYRDGPGDELQKMLPWLSDRRRLTICTAAIVTMNRWGVAGCRENILALAQWLVDEAAQSLIADKNLPFKIALALVRTSIRRFERKFPDGPLEISHE